MKACLLTEAAEWIRIGLEIGYFSSEIDPQPIVFAGINFHENRELFAYMLYISGSQYLPFEHPYQGPVQRIFADDLTTATERLDDHDGHTELIRLLYFATEEEWARRFGLLGELASTLERRPDVSFSDGVMEDLKWAFFERDDTSFGAGPADWRNTRRSTSPVGSMTSKRLDQLSAVRTRIAAACEKVGSGNESSAALLLAAILQNQQGSVSARSKDNWPLMFTEIDERVRSRQADGWWL